MIMESLKVSAGLGALALALVSNVAFAQNSTAAEEQSQSSADEVGDTEIIVTGSAKPERRFDVSYAINSLSAENIEKLAPNNYAELIGSVPGIFVETSGGEAQNITRVRGIPGDRTGLIVQQDGLPLFHQSDGLFFNSGEGMNRYDLMTERVEIVRGGPSPIYSSGGAAIVNNITVEGSATPKGGVQVTLGDTGLYRLDAYQSGALGAKTFFAVGGFIRHHDGYRDNGFPNDQGGQIRANLVHQFDNGSIKVSAQYLDDKNVFYLPIPLADPRNPAVSLDPYIDFFSGTMNSPAFRNVNFRYLDQGGALQSFTRDLSDGRHMKFGNVGLQYEGEFGNTTVSFKSGFTKGRVTFDAFYSTSNPVDGNAFLTSQLNAARTAFGPTVDHLGYTIAGVSGAPVYNPSTDSGLVMQGQYRASDADFYSVDSEFSVAHSFETGLGKHDVKAGVNGAFWGIDGFTSYQNLLVQVKGQPQALNLLAYSSTGAVLGSMTNNGILSATTTLNQNKNDARMLALYVNDTWAITDRLRLDAGIRHEWYDYTINLMQTARRPLPGPTVADTFALGFTGVQTNLKVKPSVTNWTVGVNFDFSDRIGVYGRVSNLETPPQLSGYNFFPLGTNVTSKASQYEVGVKVLSGRSYIYVTGFLSKFDPLNASFAAFNPITGAIANIPFVGTASTKGVEVDGMLRIGSVFSLSGSLTFASPEYRDFASVTGASADAILGNQIVREPKMYGHVTPTFDFELGPDTDLQVYASYDFVGKRYVDVLNTTAMPAYGTFSAGINFTHNDWKVQLVGDNLTNAHGITEGNTRTDTLSGQGTPTAIYGRPIFGRNFRLVLSKKW